MERVGEGARSHAVRLVRFLVRNFVVAHGRHRIINTLLCSGMYNNVQHTVQPPLAVPLSTQLCCLYRENEPIKSSVLHLTSCRCKTLTRSPKAAHTHIQHTYWQIRSKSSQLWHIGNPSHLRLPSDSLAMRPFDVLLAVMFDAYPACTVCRSAIVDDTTTGTKKKTDGIVNTGRSLMVWRTKCKIFQSLIDVFWWMTMTVINSWFLWC